jgi:hypothetical protein
MPASLGKQARSTVFQCKEKIFSNYQLNNTATYLYVIIIDY